MYYRGAHAALLVYDITNGDSFNDVKVWLEGSSPVLPVLQLGALTHIHST